MEAPQADPRQPQAPALDRRASAEPSGIPRLLVLPPVERAAPVDPQDRELARSLVADVTLTLCRSRLYEIIAPFTALQLAKGVATYDSVSPDYVVVTELVSSKQPLRHPLLSVHVVATGSGKQLYQSDVELQADGLMSVHSSFCGMLADRISALPVPPAITDKTILPWARLNPRMDML